MVLDVFYSKFDKEENKRGMEFGAAFGGTPVAGSTPANASFTGINPVIRNDFNAAYDELFAIGWRHQLELGEHWTAVADISNSRAKREERILETYAGIGPGRPRDTVNARYNSDGYFDFDFGYDYGDASILRLGDAGGWGQDGYIKDFEVRDNLTSLRFDLERRFDDGWFSSVEFGANLTDRTKSRASNESFLDITGLPRRRVADLPGRRVRADADRHQQQRSVQRLRRALDLRLRRTARLPDALHPSHEHQQRHHQQELGSQRAGHHRLRPGQYQYHHRIGRREGQHRLPGGRRRPVLGGRADLSGQRPRRRHFRWRRLHRLPAQPEPRVRAAVGAGGALRRQPPDGPSAHGRPARQRQRQLRPQLSSPRRHRRARRGSWTAAIPSWSRGAPTRSTWRTRSTSATTRATSASRTSTRTCAATSTTRPVSSTSATSPNSRRRSTRRTRRPIRSAMPSVPRTVKAARSRAGSSTSRCHWTSCGSR